MFRWHWMLDQFFVSMLSIVSILAQKYLWWRLFNLAIFGTVTYVAQWTASYLEPLFKFTVSWLLTIARLHMPIKWAKLNLEEIQYWTNGSTAKTEHNVLLQKVCHMQYSATLSVYVCMSVCLPDCNGRLEHQRIFFSAFNSIYVLVFKISIKTQYPDKLTTLVVQEVVQGGGS